MRTAFTVGLALAACLDGQVSAQNIYSCVDGKGRTITADRPIIECIDRTQRELTHTGTIRRELGPSLTAQERAAQDEKDKLAAEARAREAEDKRRDRALLLRYPNRAVHDQERSTALSQVDEVIKASSKRTVELAEQRKAINAELEFYVKDPSKAPPALKRRIEENDNSAAVQKRFIADQNLEKQRINQRFDEELVKLRQLWALAGRAPADAPGASKTASKN
ncbi:DUF4124 domain-containing protein [Polaromonas jejuensis]|uniref:DUF4124 domain-containing protein n=1 Tax=Polaromonas jejuensis TaxID=457502 RepID=A0ABW0Q6G0_9BURK|nr:DUF4124 domain-containing protein [Polaromonas jejuensis]